MHMIDTLADSGVEGIIYCMSDDTTQADAGKANGSYNSMVFHL